MRPMPMPCPSVATQKVLPVSDACLTFRPYPEQEVAMGTKGWGAAHGTDPALLRDEADFVPRLSGKIIDIAQPGLR
jgi:hypothetical protein